MCPALTDKALLQGAVALGGEALFRVCRVEPGAPAAVPDTVVPLGELREGLPGVRTEWFDRVLAYRRLGFSRGCRVERIARTKRARIVALADRARARADPTQPTIRICC